MSLGLLYLLTSVFAASVAGLIYPRLGFLLLIVFIASDVIGGRYG